MHIYIRTSKLPFRENEFTVFWGGEEYRETGGCVGWVGMGSGLG